AALRVALHAGRSAPAIAGFRERFPGRPLIVALAGTDANHYIDHDPQPTLRSLDYADRLVALHDLVWRQLPARFRGKLIVIHQSARPLRRRVPSPRLFDLAVIGHPRAAKGP